MTRKLINIYEADWVEGEGSGDASWRFVDLSGDHLGVRVEEISPRGTSSTHHYHSQEEEHVLVLDGTATLFWGSQKIPLKAGDHVWFAAGDEDAHHIDNTSTEAFRFLVFGERSEHDVVVYPEQKVMVVKALGGKRVTYREISKQEKPSA